MSRCPICRLCRIRRQTMRATATGWCREMQGSWTPVLRERHRHIDIGCHFSCTVNTTGATRRTRGVSVWLAAPKGRGRLLTLTRLVLQAKQPARDLRCAFLRWYSLSEP